MTNIYFFPIGNISFFKKRKKKRKSFTSDLQPDIYPISFNQLLSAALLYHNYSTF